jgi:hypothetical protein
MKRKRLIIVLAVVVVLGGALTVHSYWRRWFPSQQMKELQKLETSLGLPKPDFRYVEDLGYNKDSKGAPHYDRHIALGYRSDTAPLDMLRTKLLQDSWEQLSWGPTVSGDGTSFSFKKGTGDATQCVNGYVHPADTDTKLYISLEASGEYLCNPFPGI